VLNKKRRVKLRDIEVRIIAELMKNSRRSDRDIAKSIGTSQPTVSRTIEKLEKEGIIKEYTMIPDFKKIGYQIMGISFFKKGEPPKKEEREELTRAAAEIEEKNPFANLMAVNGMGLGKGRMFITLYRDYSRFVEAMQLAPSLPHVDAEGIDSFLVDLNQSNYRLLSLKQVARNIQAFGEVLMEEPTEKET
jgi:DNA-binding Lrp family transcriptional regulator